jgi:hypothetical protein
MRGRLAAALGAALTVIGALAPWSTISLEPIAGLRGDSTEATGISSGAGGWPLFVLVATLVVFALILLTETAPAAPRIVVLVAALAAAWGATRIVSLAGRVSDIDDPTFNVQASMSWGPWVYLAGCALALTGAALVGLLQSRRHSDDEGEESWQ